MWIYNYDANLAKQNKCGFNTVGTIFGISGMIISGIFLFVLLIVLFPDLIALWVIGLLAAIIVPMIILINKKIIYQNARQMVFVFENGIMYKLLFLGTNIPIAGTSPIGLVATAYNFQNQQNSIQNATNYNMIFEAIQRHKVGQSSYNAFVGCGTQVQEMRNIIVVKENKKYWKCKFVDEKNIARTVKIVKGFNNGFNIRNFAIK